MSKLFSLGAGTIAIVILAIATQAGAAPLLFRDTYNLTPPAATPNINLDDQAGTRETGSAAPISYTRIDATASIPNWAYLQDDQLQLIGTLSGVSTGSFGSQNSMLVSVDFLGTLAAGAYLDHDVMVLAGNSGNLFSATDGSFLILRTNKPITGPNFGTWFLYEANSYTGINGVFDLQATNHVDILITDAPGGKYVSGTLNGVGIYTNHFVPNASISGNSVWLGKYSDSQFEPAIYDNLTVYAPEPSAAFALCLVALPMLRRRAR